MQLETVYPRRKALHLCKPEFLHVAIGTKNAKDPTACLHRTIKNDKIIIKEKTKRVYDLTGSDPVVSLTWPSIHLVVVAVLYGVRR